MNSKNPKKRLDTVVQELYPHLTKNQVQGLILREMVLVDGIVHTKAGYPVPRDAQVMLLDANPKYVSRGGFKLEAALDYFKLDVTGLVVLDAGISTGGFTDCLLQRGAKKVYGVDVGIAQVHPKIADDPRVVLHEKTNLRYLTILPEKLDLATLDLSFISLTKIVPVLALLIKEGGAIIALIKPQFEAEKHEVQRGGIIDNPVIHERIKIDITTAFTAAGFLCLGIIDSPIQGAASGNKEFLGFFKRKNSAPE